MGLIYFISFFTFAAAFLVWALVQLWHMPDNPAV